MGWVDKEYIQSQVFLRASHTAGHVDCPACGEARTLLYRPVSPDLFFLDAFDLWLSHRQVSPVPGLTSVEFLSRSTEKDYKACSRALGKFFGKLRLADIHPGHVREYQCARAVCNKDAAKWTRPAGANRIRKEVDLLLRILRAAKLWGEEQDLYFQRLRPVEQDVPRAMSPEDQHRFLLAAASRLEWQFIHQYSVLALQTTASTNELRAIRLGDVMLSQGVLQIRRAGAKNKYRIRTIPLETPEVVWALERLIERAASLGSIAPHHYLFPIQDRRHAYDPLRPMSASGLKKRWAAVRTAAGVPWLRPYDLRHTAITRMAEAGTPIQVIMAFAGHMTLRMQQHYTAISMMSKRKWARATWEEEPATPARKRA